MGPNAELIKVTGLMQPLLEALFLSLKKEVNMSDKLLDNIVNTEQFIKYIYIYI
jgi:hypothetical protein